MGFGKESIRQASAKQKCQFAAGNARLTRDDSFRKNYRNGSEKFMKESDRVCGAASRSGVTTTPVDIDHLCSFVSIRTRLRLGLRHSAVRSPAVTPSTARAAAAGEMRRPAFRNCSKRSCASAQKSAGMTFDLIDRTITHRFGDFRHTFTNTSEGGTPGRHNHLSTPSSHSG